VKASFTTMNLTDMNAPAVIKPSSLFAEYLLTKRDTGKEYIARITANAKIVHCEAYA
jgi:hypothetical protein